MKIKIDQKLISVNGIDPIIDNGVILTLKDVCIAAVLTPAQDDDFKKKMEKYEIFKKFRDAVDGCIELSAEEISIVKAASGKIHPPLVYGQCCEMLENR